MVRLLVGNEGIGMSRQVIGLSALAAAILVAIVGIASTAGIATNQAETEIYSIDLSGRRPPKPMSVPPRSVLRIEPAPGRES
jgi:hypothetical protein